MLHSLLHDVKTDGVEGGSIAPEETHEVVIVVLQTNYAVFINSVGACEHLRLHSCLGDKLHGAELPVGPVVCDPEPNAVYLISLRHLVLVIESLITNHWQRVFDETIG